MQPMCKGVCPSPVQVARPLGAQPLLPAKGHPPPSEPGPHTDVHPPAVLCGLSAWLAGLHAALGLCGERGWGSLSCWTCPILPGQAPWTCDSVESGAPRGGEASAGSLVLTPSLPVHTRRWCLVPPRHGRWRCCLQARERNQEKALVPLTPATPEEGSAPSCASLGEGQRPALLGRRTHAAGEASRRDLAETQDQSQIRVRTVHYGSRRPRGPGARVAVPRGLCAHHLQTSPGTSTSLTAPVARPPDPLAAVADSGEPSRRLC